MSSKAKQFNKDDGWKVLCAFGWNFASMVMAGSISILALSPEQFPKQLLWLVPIAPILNAFLYGAKRWLDDNRK
jgi:hypothetical protein